MKLAIIENHQPLPVAIYGGIERISLFHFLAQCELNVNQCALICLEGSTVEHPNGEVIKISKNQMSDLMAGKLPLDEIVKDCDIVLTNTPQSLAPIQVGPKTVHVCVCHGDFREPTGSPHQFFLTQGQLASHKRQKPNFEETHQNIYVVPNGLDPSWFQPQEGSHGEEIVWFSSIDPRKGPHLVGALADFLGRRIVAAGNGDPRAFGSQLVEYLGVVTQEADKSKLFSFGEVYLHTAHDPVFNDPCPTTVLEAQMCGVPVVGLRSGGLSEIVFEPKFVFDKIDDLAYCLHGRHYRDLNRKHIRDWCVEHHSHLAMAKRYNKAFAAILDR